MVIRGLPSVTRRALVPLLTCTLVASILLISQPSVNYAQAATKTWARSYDIGDSFATSVRQTSDGGYIVAGVTGTSEAWFIKLDSDGIIEWNKQYSGGRVESIEQTSDGGYVASGSNTVYKLDSQGDIEWIKNYHQFGGIVSLNSIHETSAGGYIVGGDFLANGESDFWVFKLDTDGNIEWETFLGGDTFDFLRDVGETTDGGYFAAGNTRSFREGDGDAWLIKLDSNGIVEWQKAYGESGQDLGYSGKQTADGGYIIAGSISASTSHDGGLWLLKLDTSGEIEWEKVYEGQYTYVVEQTSDGGYITAGGTTEGVTADGALMLKVDSDGDVEWAKSYGGAKNGDEMYSVRETSDGGYIAAGVTETFSDSDSREFWVLKVDSEGNIDSCIDGVVHQLDITVEESAATSIDTDAVIQNGTNTARDAEFLEGDAAPEVTAQCGPLDYNLQLFENGNDPLVGSVLPGETVRAVSMIATGASVNQVTFRWINPQEEVAREFVSPATAPEDSFAPNDEGTWIVEADFGNGKVLRERFDVTFFVVPESPIGSIAMVTAAMAALVAFMYLRMIRKNPYTALRM